MTFRARGEHQASRRAPGGEAGRRENVSLAQLLPPDSHPFGVAMRHPIARLALCIGRSKPKCATVKTVLRAYICSHAPCMSYTQMLWTRLKKKAAYLPG